MGFLRFPASSSLKQFWHLYGFTKGPGNHHLPFCNCKMAPMQAIIDLVSTIHPGSLYIYIYSYLSINCIYYIHYIYILYIYIMSLCSCTFPVAVGPIYFLQLPARQQVTQTVREKKHVHVWLERSPRNHEDVLRLGALILPRHLPCEKVELMLSRHRRRPWCMGSGC